jgi:hypothetical protein
MQLQDQRFALLVLQARTQAQQCRSARHALLDFTLILQRQPALPHAVAAMRENILHHHMLYVVTVRLGNTRKRYRVIAISAQQASTVQAWVCLQFHSRAWIV